MYPSLPRRAVLPAAGALLVVSLLASPVRGETAAGTAPAASPLVQPAALPFSQAELEEALLARLLPSGDDASAPGLPRVAVEPAGEGAVAVRVGARTRVVIVGDRSGPGAARVVGLVIAELLTAGAEQPAPTAEPAAVPAGPAVTGAAPAAPSAPAAAIAAEAEPSVPPRSTWVQRLSVTAGAAKGTGSDELLAGTLDAEVVVPLPWGGLRLYPSAGLTIMPTRNAGTAEQVSFVAAAARALLGASFGPIDVGAGAVASPYDISGAVEHTGALIGAEAMARLTAPLSERLRLVVGLRVDAFADRVRVLFADGGAYATPRVQIGLGVGLAWDWAS